MNVIKWILLVLFGASAFLSLCGLLFGLTPFISGLIVFLIYLVPTYFLFKSLQNLEQIPNNQELKSLWQKKICKKTKEQWVQFKKNFKDFWSPSKNKEQWEKSKKEFKNSLKKPEEKKPKQSKVKIFTDNYYDFDRRSEYTPTGTQHVKIEYEDYNGNCSSRMLEVYELFEKEGQWFINAYCYSVFDERTFKINRCKYMLIVTGNAISKSGRGITDHKEMVRYLKGFGPRNYG